MGITRLQLYNNALMLCGERSLATVDENREPRRLLDQVHNSTGIDGCLEQGQWWFAMRAVMIDPDPDIVTSFGYKNAFTKPTDWIATSAVCQDEFFREPLTNYQDERANWYADITPIYVKYVSNDAAYGGDMGKWPSSFADFVAATYAFKVIPKLAGDKTAQLQALAGPPGQPKMGLLYITKHAAKSAAAMTQPAQRMAQGSWTRSRRGTRGGPMGDRGSPGSLTG